MSKGTFKVISIYNSVGDEADERVYYPDPRANVFKISDILNMSGIREFSTIRGNGAVILLELDWD